MKREDLTLKLWSDMENEMGILKALMKALEQPLKQRDWNKFGTIFAEMLSMSLECHARLGALGTLAEIT